MLYKKFIQFFKEWRELSTQSANGTLDDEVDRAAIQTEVSKLKEEIDRISSTTNFNGKKLLDGSIGAGATSISGYDKSLALSTAKATVTSVNGVDAEEGAKVVAIVDENDEKKVIFTITHKDGNATTKVVDISKVLSDKETGGTFIAKTGNQGVIDLSSVGLGRIEFTAQDINATAENLADDLATFFNGVEVSGIAGAGGSLTLQVGDSADAAQKVSVDISSMSSSALGDRWP